MTTPRATAKSPTQSRTNLAYVFVHDFVARTKHSHQSEVISPEAPKTQSSAADSFSSTVSKGLINHLDVTYCSIPLIFKNVTALSAREQKAKEAEIKIHTADTSAVRRPTEFADIPIYLCTVSLFLLQLVLRLPAVGITASSTVSRQGWIESIAFA